MSAQEKPRTYTLFHADSVGSVFTLAVLRVLQVPHDLVVCDYEAICQKKDTPGYRRLIAANPLAQFPTLITPDGTVMTEGAAIALYLHDKHAAGTAWSNANLTAPQLALFYRIMVFIPANIYPTITVIDFPERFIEVPHSSHVSYEAACGWVAEKGKVNRESSFRLLEMLLRTPRAQGDVKSAFALGTTHPTLVDIYIALISHYSPRPRPQWLETNCPLTIATARETINCPVLQQVFEVENEFDVPIRVESGAFVE